MWSKISLLACASIFGSFFPSGPICAQAAQPPAAPINMYPVYALTSVDVLSTKSNPVKTVIVVRGVTPSDNWTGPELTMTALIGPDHVLDLTFIAHPDGEPAKPDFSPVEATFQAGTKEGPLAGVRVRSATNVLSVRGAEGHADSGHLELEDFSKLIGRRIASAGQSPPDSSYVQESHLPIPYRIVGTRGPITDLTVNPNRLTLFLDDSGTIQSAIWR